MDAPAGRAWTRLRTRPWTRLQDAPVKCACKARRRIRELRVPTAGAPQGSPGPHARGVRTACIRGTAGSQDCPPACNRVFTGHGLRANDSALQGTAGSQDWPLRQQPGSAQLYTQRASPTQGEREGKQPQGKYIATKVTLTRAEQETIALSSRSVAVKKKEVPAAPYRVQGMYVLWFLAMSAERPRMSAGLGLLIKVGRGQRPRNVRGL